MNFSTHQVKSKVREQVKNSTELQKLQQKYQALSQRERLLLWLMAGLLIVYVLYGFIWSPLKQSEMAAQQQLDNAHKTYQLLAQNAQLIASTQQNNGTLQDRSAQELQSFMTGLMRQHKVVAQRFNLEGDSRLQIWVENTSYATIAKLFSAMAQNKVAIYNLQLISRQAGMVDMRLTLD
ncbi:hypothetical protein CBF23_002745 [Marinomonas agarivorans]|nr:hypothetical protein CBF23_002745 [Marinomonas agarivorans]